MAYNKLTKKIAQELMKVQGEARGIHLKNDAEYILKEKGEKGLKKVEKELKRLGVPINYKKIKNLEFYPAGLRALSLLATREVFNLDNEAIKEICRFSAKTSFIVKLYVKFFYSVPKLLEKSSAIWEEHWTKGELSVKSYNKKEQRVVLEIKNFNLHPIYCRCLEGYFEGITKMARKAEEIKCKETECFFKKGKLHQFEIMWK